MSGRVMRKWRPPLALVLGGVLLAVLVAPLAGFFALRLLDDYIGAKQALVLVASAALVLTFVLGFLLWRLILWPVRALAYRADAITNGDTSAREPLEHYGTPELRDLGQSVMDMAEVLHGREAAIRNYTDHITHELKTPITSIRGAAELLNEMPDRGEEDRELLASILESSNRMEQLLNAARKIAAARAPEHVGISSLSQVLPALAARFAGLVLQVEGADVDIPLGREGLEIVLQHLIENASEHGAKAVALKVSATADALVLSVRDDGEGVSDGNRDRIFAPFFTTKRATGGTGMGLSIVHSLLRTHQADIHLENRHAGAGFIITF